MRIKKISCLLFLLIFLNGCTYNSVVSKQVKSKLITLPSEKPVMVDLKIDSTFDYGLITVKPTVTEKYTQYRKVNTREHYREKTLTATNIVAATSLASMTYGLSLLAIQTKCGNEKFVKCSEINQHDSEALFEHGFVHKPIDFSPDEIQMKISDASGKMIFIPLNSEGVLTTSFRELGFPKQIKIEARYKDLFKSDFYDEAAVREFDNREAIFLSTDKLPRIDFYFSLEPMKALSQRLQSHMETYVESVSQPFFPEPPYLDEIPAPVYPEPPVVTKDQFETRAEFESRLLAARADYHAHIKGIEESYRKAVEKRNSDQQQLMTKHNNYIRQIEKQYESRIGFLRDSLAEEKRYQLARLVEHTYGYLRIDSVNYDADTSTVFTVIRAINANQEWTFATKMDREAAKIFHSAPKNAQATLQFSLVDENKLLVSSAQLKVDGQAYKLRIDDAERSHEPLQVAVAGVVGKPLPVHAKASSIEPQTITKFKGYEPGSVEISLINQKLDYEDDLISKVSSFKPIEVNANRWLIVIGIEKYQFTDNVLFARRSAELFTELAQKRFGISERHTYKFYDEEASSAALKDQLRLLLSNIKSSDEIILYYSGHGVPDISSGNEPYLLPSDKVPGFVTEDKALRVRQVLAQMSATPASKVIAFLDSCFSAVTDNRSVLKGVAASRLVPGAIVIDDSKVTVITAGRGDQFSNAYIEKGHRLFSYYLMRSMLGEERDLKDIYRQVYRDVKEQSLKFGDLQKQEPSFFGQIEYEI